MCGICGIVHYDRGRSINGDTLRAMNDVLSHRGPDAEGFYLENNIGLGHRRLSIIDLASGAQPMFDAGNNIVITYNGELYNYKELREELKGLKHNFQTDSDTEVIIEAYIEWGAECLQKFIGMWAFAIWDKPKKRLFIARDRIGEKPLYYALFDNSLLFGSEIKAISAYGHPKEINPEVIDLYLTLGYVPAPYSFYKNIHKLMPGYYGIIENGELQLTQYWDLPEIDEANMLTDKNLINKKFQSILEDSVNIQMRSDVSYGAFLSGGLDSSSIVSLMSGRSQEPINTFTIGYNEKDFDETALAKQVANAFNTVHAERIVEPSGFHESLDKAIKHFDEPFGDSSAIPTSYVSAFAREKVKMVLTGDGGDEVLSGYTTYQGEKFAKSYQGIPRSIRHILSTGANVASSLTKGQLGYKANRVRNVLESSSLSFQDRLVSKRAWIERSKLKMLLEPIKGYMPIEDYFSDLMTKCTYRDPFYQLMYFHFKVSLPDDMLVKVDRMTMAHSLEARTPFLDYRLIEYMVGVSKKVKMRGYERKSILRDTVGQTLPPDLLKAPKRGFSVPLRHWFAGEDLKSDLDELQDNELGLNSNIIAEIVKDNRSKKQDYGNFIWMLMILDKTMKSKESH